MATNRSEAIERDLRMIQRQNSIHLWAQICLGTLVLSGAPVAWVHFFRGIPVSSSERKSGVAKVRDK